jgi:hypothetical protein
LHRDQDVVQVLPDLLRDPADGFFHDTIELSVAELHAMALMLEAAEMGSAAM